MDRSTLNTLKEALNTHLGSRVKEITLEYGELTLRISAGDLLEVAGKLRDYTEFEFKMLVDITAADYPEFSKRFELVYHFLSVSQNMRMRLKLRVSAAEPVESLSGLFASAIWPEREVWDMFGVHFVNHPDLRRLLTDYGFEGHPLRKDFPLSGHSQVRYSEAERRVVYEPLSLTQDYRSFDYLSPWGNMTPQQPLPGDEKASKEGA